MSRDFSSECGGSRFLQFVFVNQTVLHNITEDHSVNIMQTAHKCGTAIAVSFITVDICIQFDKCYE